MKKLAECAQFETNAMYNRRRDRGQTLIIALIILSVLLILGFVFLGFIDRNIVNAGQYRKRSLGSNLAEAGINYAHQMALTSPLGADWRGSLTPITPAGGNPNFTRDPDADYLRPGTGLAFDPNDPSKVDLGGPDGLGFYTRVNFSNGRALIRVRYAPSDANIFSSSPTGALRNPGAARDYLIIESIGRPGIINPNDPTSAGSGPLVQFQNFSSAATLQSALATMANSEKSFVTSRKLVAFESIGMLESALYITNKDRVTRAADIGVPSELGANYLGNPINVAQTLGENLPMFNLTTPPTPTINPIGIGGSIFSNANLIIHNTVSLDINTTLGDMLAVNGTIEGSTNNAQLIVYRNEYMPNRPSSGLPAGWYGGYPQINPANTPIVLSGATLNSDSPSFSTAGGAVRDGVDATDAGGFSRGIGYKAPPLIDYRDPSTGNERYYELTRDSGTQEGLGNSGEFGFGQGVYINNFKDQQLPASEAGKAIAGSSASLENDWLNPNNGLNPNSGWKGPFYTPIGTYIQLLPDGFLVTRDATDPGEEFWRNPDGTYPASRFSTIRYRLGLGSDKKVHIINGLTPGVTDINATAQNFNLGPIFNGVIYLEGNARVRGVIPTDVQLTIVSNANIYIEGSITKGVVGSDVATDAPRGQLLSRPSHSALMLMAKDYVVLNTTQFFGPGNTPYQVDQSGSTAVGTTPAILRNVGDTLDIQHEFLLNPDPVNPTTPATNPYSPSTWQPYDTNYTPVGSTQKLSTILLLSHSMDPNSGSAAFISLEINASLQAPNYLFPLVNAEPGVFTTNAAEPILGANFVQSGYTTPGYDSLYGLGIEPFQRYANFENMAFPFETTNFGFNATNDLLTGSPTNPTGMFSIEEQATNNLTFQLSQLGQNPTSSYYLAKAAIVPADIRIEASIYAQDGSFFVIPGTWFNPNPNDSRQNYEITINQFEGQGYSLADATNLANEQRLQNFGSVVDAPFYGEPLDVKVTVFGSVSENMPPPASVQAQWEQKWGWIPVQQGADTRQIPAEHQQNGSPGQPYVPNLSIVYDPMLATDRVEGFSATNNPTSADQYVRVDKYGRPLPPMPRLPVSPTLAYYGDEQF